MKIKRVPMPVIVLAILLLFESVILIARRQEVPTESHDIAVLFAPTSCSMPCFLGIQPGVTSVDEAIHILMADSWIEHVEPHYTVVPNSLNTVWGWVDWDWKPTVEGTTRSTGGHSGSFQIVDGLVDTISIGVASPPQDLFPLWGKPNGYVNDAPLTMYANGPIPANMQLPYMSWAQYVYLDKGLQIGDFSSCNTEKKEFHGGAILTFSSASHRQDYETRLLTDQPLSPADACEVHD